MPDLTPLQDLQAAMTPESHTSNAERLLLVADDAVTRGDFNHAAELAALAHAHAAVAGQLTMAEVIEKLDAISGYIADLQDTPPKGA
jgi:hypothetical protein